MQSGHLENDKPAEAKGKQKATDELPQKGMPEMFAKMVEGDSIGVGHVTEVSEARLGSLGALLHCFASSLRICE